MPVSVYDSVWLRMRVHVCTTPCLRTPMCMLLCQRIHSMLLCHNAYTHTHAHPTHASTVTYLNAYIHTPILCIAHKPRNINRPPPLFSPSPVHPTHSIVFVRKFLFVCLSLAKQGGQNITHMNESCHTHIYSAHALLLHAQQCTADISHSVLQQFAIGCRELQRVAHTQLSVPS